MAAASPRRAAPAPPPRQHAAGTHTHTAARPARARAPQLGPPRTEKRTTPQYFAAKGAAPSSVVDAGPIATMIRRKSVATLPRALRDGGRTGHQPCSELQADDVAHSGADGEADARAVLQAGRRRLFPRPR